jgi:hypothetical protein|tara:strand:- start:9585 stop:9977 length:393 start_codon:yes stop_codon:yes gene_type:complete
MSKLTKICYIVGAIVGFIVIINLFARTREGLKNKMQENVNIVELPDRIKGANSDVESSLLLGNHRSEYEDVLINLNDGLDFQILNALKKGGEHIAKDATSEESFKTIRKINELRKLKDGLKETMTFLDSK